MKDRESIVTNRCEHGYKSAIGCEICSLRARVVELGKLLEEVKVQMGEFRDEIRSELLKLRGLQ